MTRVSPITFTWEGDCFRPVGRFARLADQQFVIGETYDLAPIEERSAATHRHYFAVIHEAWVNLPERMSERFPTSEHLRKWALIKAGYRNERTVVCASRAEALKIKAFVRPIDDYAVVLAQAAVVLIYTAKSQSVKAMGKDEFQASKQAVLDVISELIGVEVTQLEKAAA